MATVSNEPDLTVPEALARLTHDQFVELANRHYSTPELKQQRPTGVSEEIASLCDQIVRGEGPEREDVGPIEAREAAILTSWLAFKRAAPDPMANQLIGISATSLDKARSVLYQARAYAKDVLETIVRDNDLGHDAYQSLARQVFAADTQDQLAINGASQCHTYSRNNQFRCSVLLQDEAAKKVSGRDMGFWRLRVLFR